jgi:hypothetical protein
MSTNMNAEQKFQGLLERQQRIDIAELHAFFDTLEAVPEDFMLGEWGGGVFLTGHPGESQLTGMKWAGKHFYHRNQVDPIICQGENGTRYPSDVMGKAALREMAYRGVVTATMIYDKHPVYDHFRKISEDTVLGVMDRKGEEVPLYFYLRRV